MNRARLAVVACAVAIAAAACSSSSHHAAPPTTPSTVGPGPQLVNADGFTDHWHAALGVDLCGAWQPGPIWPTTGPVQGNLTLTRHDAQNQYAGLHTHQLANGESDGLIHMEPAQPDEAGRNATLGRYMEFGGWRVTATSLQLWGGANSKPIAVRNGERCGTQPAVVRWATGTFVPGKPTQLTEQHGDPSHLQLTDNQVIALYFVPSSTALASLGPVPSVPNLPSAASLQP